VKTPAGYTRDNPRLLSGKTMTYGLRDQSRDQITGLGQRAVQCAYVAAASLGEIRPPSTFASNHRCKLADDLAGLHFPGEVLRDTND
jgi:hypothetical protein